MLKEKQQLNAFWTGFSSAMSLLPTRRRRPAVRFRGKELLSTSSSEALAEDWVIVGSHISAALSKSDLGDAREQHEIKR